MKAILERFEGFVILVAQPTVQLLKFKDQYNCLVKLLETMESVKYTIKEAVQANQTLDLEDDTCGINCYIEKKESKTVIFLKL